MSYVPRILIMTDIVAYSKMSLQEQARSVENLLNTWFRKDWPFSTKPLDCAVLPTGDGFIGVLPQSDSGGVPVWLLDFVVAAMDGASDAVPPFKIRFGLHSGACRPVQITSTSVDFEATPNNYLGYDMNYVARLVGCAGPGQLVASSEFNSALESTIVANERYQVWRDEFLVAFKGDRVEYTLLGCNVTPSMEAARSIAIDSRTVHSLVLRMNDKSKKLYGTASVPNNAVQYTGKNNHHGLGAVHRTNFQLFPDQELFNLYRMEPRIAAVTDGPFFTRLPFAVRYALGDDGVLNVIQQNEEEVDWQIDVSWPKKFFGQFDNGKLCSLSGLDLDVESLEAKFSYTHCWYEQSLATVISPDRCVNGHLSHTLRNRLLVTDHSGQMHHLPPLDSRLLAAHIGVTAIVITSDGLPIIQPRGSKGLHSNINSESASASGAVDWKDWEDLRRSLRINLAHEKVLKVEYNELIGKLRPEGKGGELLPSDRAILREAAEEIGLLPEDIESIKLVGIAREFRRLGKPEFFYLIRSNQRATTTVKQANLFATYKWEYGGKLKVATNVGFVPPKREQQKFYFANYVADMRFNEITRLAFYFLLRYVSGKHAQVL